MSLTTCNPCCRSFLAFVLLLALVIPAGACQGQQTAAPARTAGAAADGRASHALPDSTFAGLIERLSEPGGYFDTDNLISNETSYLHVLGRLREMGVRGGAYLGVGRDQNFSYIARIRPDIAFIVDIRRDNLLQHLFFKALFGLSQNRIAFLSLLFGKPVPQAPATWEARTVQDLLAYIEAQPARQASADAATDRVLSRVETFGVPLTDAERETIRRIHAAFITAGLDLRFTSHNRAPRPYYPTYRQLLLEHDLTGEYGSYMAQEGDFQFVKALQEANRIVPVVGDLGGRHALRAIAAYLAGADLAVSAFYTSNVEFYLMRQGSFEQFARNVSRMPLMRPSVLIRSYFNRYGADHPQTVPGYASTQLLQTLQSFVEEYEQGGYASYYDLIDKHILDLRVPARP